MFAFVVGQDGRISEFSDRGGYGRIGPNQAQARELDRIQHTLETDPRCSPFPENLRRRYVAIDTLNGRLKVDQVRDEAARR